MLSLPAARAQSENIVEAFELSHNLVPLEPMVGLVPGHRTRFLLRSGRAPTNVKILSLLFPREREHIAGIRKTLHLDIHIM
jgi:hypothetical protein